MNYIKKMQWRYKLAFILLPLLLISGFFVYISGAGKVEAIMTTPLFTSATASSGYQINLVWTDNCDEEDGFRLLKYKWGSGLDYALVADLPANTTTFSDSTVVPNSTYVYQIYAYNEGGNTWYDTRWASTPDIPPLAPTNIVAIANSNAIHLSWQDNAYNEDYYKIYRTDPGNTFEYTWTASANASSTDFNWLKEDSWYSFRVCAYSRSLGETCAPDIIRVHTPLSIEINKEGPASAKMGDNVDYTITIKNNTGSQITGARFEDVLDNRLMYLGSNVNGVVSSGIYSAVFNLAINETKVITISTKLLGEIMAPSNLVANVMPSKVVDLVWNDNSNNEEGFIIERSTSQDFTQNFTRMNSTSAHYEDANIQPGIVYYYRVRAHYGTLESAASDTVTVDTTSICLAAPTNLRGVSSVYSEMNLSWTDNATCEHYYVVETIKYGKTVSYILPASSTSFKDTGLVGSTEYSYKIYPISTVNPPPAAPSNLRTGELTWNSGSHSWSLGLSWNDNSNDETMFMLDRSLDANFSPSATVRLAVPANLTQTATFVDDGLESSTPYYYKVASAKIRPDALFSTGRFTTTNPPDSPINLHVVDIDSQSLKIAWDDISSVETGFQVGYTTDPNFSIPRSYANTGANDTDIIISDSSTTPLKPGTTYYFRIRAKLDGDTFSPWSKIYTIQTLSSATPAAPSNLTVSSASSTSVTLNWQDNSDNEHWFYVTKSTNSSLIPNERKLINKNITQYIDTAVTPGLQYYYAVEAARNDSGSSQKSLANTVIPGSLLIQKPTNLNVTPLPEGKMNVQWQDNSNNESYFLINQSLDSEVGTNWVWGGKPASNKSSFSLTVTKFTEPYNFTIRACTADNRCSAYSDTVKATPIAGAVPEAPSNLVADTQTTGTISLTWRDNSYAEHGFIVTKSTNSNLIPNERFQLDEGTISFVDSHVSPGVEYFYAVEAMRLDSGSSPKVSISAVASGSLLIQKPTNFSATPYIGGSIVFEWQDNSDNEAYFKISYAKGSETAVKWESKVDILTDLTGYVLEMTDLSQPYHFTIQACTSDNRCSAYSDVVVATPIP